MSSRHIANVYWELLDTLTLDTRHFQVDTRHFQVDTRHFQVDTRHFQVDTKHFLQKQDFKWALSKILLDTFYINVGTDSIGIFLRVPNFFSKFWFFEKNYPKKSENIVSD